MFDLLDLLAARLDSIMAEYLFDDPAVDPPGDPRQIRILKLGLQPKRYRSDQGQDYPFVTMRLLGGDDKSGKSTMAVELIFGIYINPDVDKDGDVDASDDMIDAATEAMAQVVLSIRTLGDDGNYYPYSLESMTWQVGDKEGLHPGPDYYQISARLTFSQAPIF